jgi:hypothetical protein
VISANFGLEFCRQLILACNYIHLYSLYIIEFRLL